VESNVRQLLADKISGTLTGQFLLIPEFLRLGVHDLLQGLFNKSRNAYLSTRLGLQLINESALCVNGIRKARSLSQKGFEIANGLPYIVSDVDVYRTFESIPVEKIIELQIAFGKIRRAAGHYKGQTIAIDPHRIISRSKRQMERKKVHNEPQPVKTSQLFFAIDAETKNAICFTQSTSSMTVTKAMPNLLKTTREILYDHNEVENKMLILADSEHFTKENYFNAKNSNWYDLLTPMPAQKYYKKMLKELPDESFTQNWPGYATTTIPFYFKDNKSQQLYYFGQREGLKRSEYDFSGFLCSADRNEVEALTMNFPDRWHIEEFFKKYQDLGWRKAGTQNLNIRYGKATMALIAQAGLFQLQKRLGEPFANWDAQHMADSFFRGLDGDIRVKGDELIVTYYNAQALSKIKEELENVSAVLEREGIDPRIPWLYDYKLRFRFR